MPRPPYCGRGLPWTRSRPGGGCTRLAPGPVWQTALMCAGQRSAGSGCGMRELARSTSGKGTRRSRGAARWLGETDRAHLGLGFPGAPTTCVCRQETAGTPALTHARLCGSAQTCHASDGASQSAAQVTHIGPAPWCHAARCAIHAPASHPQSTRRIPALFAGILRVCHARCQSTCVARNTHFRYAIHALLRMSSGLSLRGLLTAVETG